MHDCISNSRFVLSFLFVDRRFYLLTDSDKYTVGCGAQSDLLISDDISISGEHAIIRSSSGVQVKNLDSEYGIFLNDGIEKNQRILKKNKVDLKVGYIVRFGQLENIFRLENIDVKICTSLLEQEDCNRNSLIPEWTKFSFENDSTNSQEQLISSPEPSTKKRPHIEETSSPTSGQSNNEKRRKVDTFELKEIFKIPKFGLKPYKARELNPKPKKLLNTRV